MEFGKYENVRQELSKDENMLSNKIVAMSNQLAKSQIRWTMTQKKLFVAVISQLRWRKLGNSTEIVILKKDVAEKLGVNYDSTDLSRYLRNEFKKMVKKSFVEWENPFAENEKDIEYECGFLFTNYRSTRNECVVKINPEFMPHLEGLLNNYMFFLSEDVYNFKSGFSFDLYKHLQVLYDNRYFVNVKLFTTKQLKDIFGLSKEDYTNKKTKKFDRYNFEKYTIEVAVREINESYKNGGMMHINKWEKKKVNGFVKGYVFEYVVRQKDAISEGFASTVIEQDEIEPDMQMTIDADGNTWYEPIADKDILKGSE